MENFKHKVSPLKSKVGQTNEPVHLVKVDIEFKDGKLSLVGSAYRSAGQFQDYYLKLISEGLLDKYYEYNSGWTEELTKRLFDLWNRWHLNNLRTGCAHQRNGWDLDKTIILKEYKWTMDFYKRRQAAQDGKLSTEQYAKYAEHAELVRKLLFVAGKEPKWDSPEIVLAKSLGLIEDNPQKNETKSASWVYPENHPEGLLTRACGICGWKYGSGWLKEEVPENVLQELFDMPRLQD